MKNKPILIIAITFFVILGIVIFLIRPVVSSILVSWIKPSLSADSVNRPLRWLICSKDSSAET